MVTFVGGGLRSLWGQTSLSLRNPPFPAPHFRAVSEGRGAGSSSDTPTPEFSKPEAPLSAPAHVRAPQKVSTALKVPAVQWEHRDGDMPCGAATLEAGAMGTGEGLLTHFWVSGETPTGGAVTNSHLLRHTFSSQG